MTTQHNFVNFESKSKNPHFEGVYDIEPKELQTKMDQVTLIDVRQPEEYTGELGHITKSELVVLGTIPEKISTLPKDKTVVFICKSGGRSAQATAFALTNGFTHVYNLRGGMTLWNQLSLPTSK